MNTIAENINDIKNRIEKASNGRKITLLAVTKTFSAECAKQAIDTGILDIAESKIQEALPKFEVLSNSLNGINKHFIGHLQSNKAKKAVLNFDLIQSL
ncbi:MAG: YggS family pyridoxal phosphate-dependent enzyme, partial [Elusimicrobia bacterium]|nr:YggS family pyridoxal phosphate-dependent enzyme [Elusimicrobiota bacterium]